MSELFISSIPNFFLMPSYFEPCGLGQMISLRYGTLPLVRKTGGLADTVFDLTNDPSKGNGFVFEGYEVKNFLNVIDRALSFYDQPSRRIVTTGFSGSLGGSRSHFL